MPRTTKKERRLAQCQRMSMNDVTLSDFADASMSCPSAHVKKGVVNVHLDKEKVVKVTAQCKQELAWYEKDLDDFNVDTKDDEVKEDVSSPTEPLTFKNKRKSKKGKQLHVQVKEGLEYPDDLWYILSSYVYPESVSTFARLCKATHRIISSIGFWRNLYHRYYNESTELPKTLQPVCLERIHGLQSKVVRSLYYLYQPFVERLIPRVSMEDEPHRLIGQKCLLSWYQPVNNKWHFCFKFVKPGQGQHIHSSEMTQRQLIDQYDDVFHNVEHGCTVLQVTCSHFLAMPFVMGQVLNRVYLTVGGQGMRDHTLRMVFDTRYQHQRVVVGTNVILDSVVSIKVIPWWDPKYPFTS